MSGKTEVKNIKINTFIKVHLVLHHSVVDISVSQKREPVTKVALERPGELDERSYEIKQHPGTHF